MSGSKWSKMFFRNTLVAHKSLINPYFSVVVVQQASLYYHIRDIEPPEDIWSSGVFYCFSGHNPNPKEEQYIERQPNK